MPGHAQIVIVLRHTHTSGSNIRWATSWEEHGSPARLGCYHLWLDVDKTYVWPILSLKVSDMKFRHARSLPISPVSTWYQGHIGFHNNCCICAHATAVHTNIHSLKESKLCDYSAIDLSTLADRGLLGVCISWCYFCPCPEWLHPYMIIGLFKANLIRFWKESGPNLFKLWAVKYLLQ